jgi:hypothetical protein
MPESTVKLEIRSYDSESKKHCHRYHQLVLPLAGELWLVVDHQEGAVVRHKAAVIPSDRNHGFAAPADNRFLVADVPEQAAPDLERVPRFVELDPALLHYVRFLEAQVSLRATSGSRQRQMVLLLVLAGFGEATPVLIAASSLIVIGSLVAGHHPSKPR